MRVRNDPIPKNRLQQFDEILKATGGRYVDNPRDCGDVYRVDYDPGDYKKMCELWRRATTEVVEVRRDQWWRRTSRHSLNFVLDKLKACGILKA